MGAWRTRLGFGYRPGRLGRNALLGSAGLGLRAVIQAGYLLVVSRWLGAEGYGLFAGSVALVTLGTPLANWGSSLLLTSHIARDRRSSRAMWATALVQTGVVGSLLVVCALVVSALMLHQRLPLLPMLLLALSELILLPAALAANSQCFALERGVASAITVCLVPLGRILALFAVVAMGLAASPEHAAAAHFAGSIAGLLAVFAVVAAIDGWPAWRARLPLRDATQQGTAYAISNAAGTSYQEVDKVLMLQILGAAAVGSYSVAFRVASIFILPIAALISATLPRLMALHGNGGQSGTSRALLAAALGYGLLAGIAMMIAAPFVPLLFGSGYEQATTYLLLLTPWPVLFAWRQCLAAGLTASNRQQLRSTVEMAGLALVVALNSILLSRIGETAAVASLLLTEAAVSVIFWMTIRNRKSYAPPEP